MSHSQNIFIKKDINQIYSGFIVFWTISGIQESLFDILVFNPDSLFLFLLFLFLLFLFYFVFNLR